MKRAAKIVDLDEHRPHGIIWVGDHAHIVPVRLIERWIAGSETPKGPLLRRIIQEWWGNLQK